MEKDKKKSRAYLERVAILEKHFGRFRAGDEQVLKDLLRETYSIFRHSAENLVPDEQEFQDIFNESILYAWTKRGKINDGEHLHNYLNQRIMNGASRSRSRGQKTTVLTGEMEDKIGEEDQRIGQWEVIDPMYEWRKLDKAIDKLSKCYRKVLIPFFREGKTDTQIAEELGLQQPVVSRLKAKGLQKLKKQFKYLPEMLSIEAFYRAMRVSLCWWYIFFPC